MLLNCLVDRYSALICFSCDPSGCAASCAVSSEARRGGSSRLCSEVIIDAWFVCHMVCTCIEHTVPYQTRCLGNETNQKGAGTVLYLACFVSTGQVLPLFFHYRSFMRLYDHIFQQDLLRSLCNLSRVYNNFIKIDEFLNNI